jgi:catechol 2,3-dioxygenase
METPVRVTELGHVSLYVRDLDAARHFYHDVLGLLDAGTGKGGRILFFSAGVHHHDLSCELARTAGPGPPPGAPGLYHIAFAVGRTGDDLDRARRWVEAHGLVRFGETDNSFSIRDPDGNQIELYVESTLGRRIAKRARAKTTTPKAGR